MAGGVAWNQKVTVYDGVLHQCISGWRNITTGGANGLLSAGCASADLGVLDALGGRLRASTQLVPGIAREPDCQLVHGAR